MKNKSTKKKEEPSCKQITFDLNQDALSKYYPRPKLSKNPLFYKKAYKDISRFMKKEGFKHTQYSVYVSNKKLYSYNITAMMKRMAKEMPWLSSCVNEIDVTDVGNQYKLKNTLDKFTKLNDVAVSKENEKQNKETEVSMSEWKTKVSGNNSFSRQPDNISRTAEPRDDIGR